MTLNTTINPLFTIFALLFIMAACHPKNQQSFTQEIEENIQLDHTMLGVSVIADSLFVPWELVWGPDDWIWVTERPGTISRINPTTGEKRVLLQLKIGDRPEGAQAMIVHPDPENYPYVFINYKRFNSDSIRYNVVERYTYERDSLVDPKLIMETPAGPSHHGARLAFHGPERILWATGDQTFKETVQDLTTLNGKILRMDLEGNIPDDNPIQGSYVYAWGFRNMQGMVVTPQSKIYISEHGDATEDEVNLIHPKGNYGFPDIEGTVDNDLERIFAKEHQTIGPLLSWTPTIAPAGMDYYASNKVPEWQNALLLTMLKGQGLRVLNLNETGDEIIREEVFLEKRYGRIRDICVSPAGDIYISTSNHDWNPMTQPDDKDDRILRIAKVDTAVKTPLTAKTAAQEIQQNLNGETLYQQYCFSCHKDKGEGLKDIYPSLVGSKVVNDKEQLLTILLNGITEGDYAMPKFDFLENEELGKIANYIRMTYNAQIEHITIEEIATLR